ncbi:MAG: glycosyltransferase family 4 protein [Candidatus Contendobacter sp.]|nr:glycosyltransferase family 4 protein [Candidatus Contendobacter sp.]
MNLRFVDYLARGVDLSSCYQAGDAFVFASRTETQGLVLLEAMSLGVPVVSTAVMGTRDILAAKRGALIAEEDVPRFAAQVRRLLSGRCGIAAAVGRGGPGLRQAMDRAGSGPGTGGVLSRPSGRAIEGPSRLTNANARDPPFNTPG